MMGVGIKQIGRGAVLAVLLATSLGLLAACAQPPVPEDRFYRLSLTSLPEAAPAPVLKGVLEVDRLLADGITAGRPIVYSTAATPNQLKEYNYHFWTEPPTVMLQDQLVKYLRAGGLAENIVTPEMRVRADYVLSGKIQRLEKVVGSSPKVVLEMELSLRHARSEKLVHVGSYRHEASASDDSVLAAVKALNGALASIYADFTKEVGGL